MPKPNLDDYVDVATRLQRFREKYPEGSIQTEVYHDDGKAVRVKARVYRMDFWDGAESIPVGTGHAEEIRGEGPVNKTSALENCETSAVGRALAMAGFEVSKGVASKQEVEQAQQEERRQAEDNGGIPLTRLRELREKINSQAPSRDELGLMLVTVGIEHGPVIDALANQHITQAQAKRAVEIITPEQADALTGALDTGELS